MFHLSLSSSLPSRRNTHTYTPISISFLPHLRSLSQLTTTIIIFETFSLPPPSLPQPHQNPSPPISASRFHFLPHCSAPPPFSCFVFRRATTVDGEKEVKLRPFQYFLSHASILKLFLMVPFPFQFLFCPTLGGGHFPAKRTNFRRPTVARDGKNAHQDWVSLR